MCGINNQGDDTEKIKKQMVNQRNANGVSKTMNSYGEFFNNAARTPVNILEIKKNRDNYNKRLEALMNGEDDPALY
tara:strand:+ start:1330 stop:1557 length:228 start_codon:yes stop_codon:yes gene_type:complete